MYTFQFVCEHILATIYDIYLFSNSVLDAFIGFYVLSNFLIFLLTFLIVF